MNVVRFIIMAVFVLPMLSSSNIINVPDSAATIQAGVDLAETGDTVLVSDGIYSGAGNENIDMLGKAIVLKSENGPEYTILRPPEAGWIGYRAIGVVSGEDSMTVIDGFTIANFRRENDVFGGAMMVRDASPTIRNCVFYNNSLRDYHHQMDQGGAICFWNSKSRVENCTFVKNFCDVGSAIDCVHSQVTFTNCLFAYNIGRFFISWDIWRGNNYDHQPQMINCNFFGNDPIDDPFGYEKPFLYIECTEFDPKFCDLEQGDLTVSSQSECLPQNNLLGELIGALGEGCIVTDVYQSEDIALPLTHSISQNYPNPFNPLTTIAFEIPTGERITLEVFNILGQKVDTLADRFFSAGSHKVTWDASANNGKPISSGVYLYRLKSESFSETKKMLLVK